MKAQIARAVAILNAGGIVAAPTETVYGLAARASDASAVARIYLLKDRPSFNPLIVHVRDAGQAAALVEIEPLAATLMAAFWPGALTLVLPLLPDAGVAKLVTAGLPTLAVRCPAHKVMRALIDKSGPLAAPSANASGRLSPTRAAHVRASFGDAAPLILDGGPCPLGLESTIIAVADGVVTLLRAGAIPAEVIEAVTGAPLLKAGEGVTAPGMLASHYAPRQPVRLEALTADRQEYHIGFGAVAGDATLSATSDLTEAAARLFDLLHVAEASGRAGIAVAPVPETGLGAAINDRLRRAAAARQR